MYRRTFILLTFIAASFLYGCGSAPESGPKKTVASLKGVNLESGQTINGLSMVMELPPGVFFKTVQLTGVPAADPATPSASSSFVKANAAPSQSVPGGTTLTIGAIIASGFGPNQSIDIDCAIVEGTSGDISNLSGFFLTGFEAKDQNGAVITGLSRPTIDYTFY